MNEEFIDEGDIAIQEQEESEDRLEDLHEAWIDSMTER